MPSARVAAAATGLPEEIAADFHLSIGRDIARINAAMATAEAQEAAMEAIRHPGQHHLVAEREHLEDREVTLIRALAASRASSLAGATVQIAAAARIFGWIAVDLDHHPEEERAVRRLLASALRVMTDASGLDPVGDGIVNLASPTSDPWRDVYERIAEIFPFSTAADG